MICPGAASSPSDTLLRAALAHGHELALITDRRGQCLWSNEAWQEAVGANAAAIGNIVQLVDENCPNSASHEAIHRALADGLLASTEFALRGRSGQPLWVRCRVTPIDEQLLWQALNLTEQRAMAARAQQLEEQLEVVQDFGRLGVWERDIASGIGHWDRRVFAFWGLDPSLGTPPFDEATNSIHVDDRPAVYAYHRASLQQAGHYDWRYRVLRPDGSMRWIHSQWQVTNDASGKPARALGTMVDDTEVYELARSLGDASAQLKLAVELADIGIWRHDLHLGQVYLNDRAFGILGLPVRAEGMPLNEAEALIHPDDIAHVRQTGRAALEADGPVHFEARYRRNDGQWRHVMMRRVVQRSPDGTPLAFVGVGLDVTEQVARQRENTKLAERLDLAASAVGLGIWTMDAANEEDDTWNDQMFLLCGLQPDTPRPSRAQWLHDFVVPQDRNIAASTRRRLLAAEADRVEVEYRIVRADGQIRWLSQRARIETLSGRNHLVGVVLDITEQRTAQQALRDADQRAALAARSAGIGTWELRVDTGEERWDEQMFHLRNLQPALHPPSRAQRLALLHPDDRDQTIDGLVDVHASQQPLRYEFRVMLPDGGIRWLASRSIAVEDEQGRLTRRIGVNWDITEAKEGELARQQAAVAERASQAKSQFLSRMSHELRTPLNAVLGFSQLLQMQAQASGDRDQVAKLGHIHAAGSHLLRLIDGVLDLSTMESGELPLNLVAVDMVAMVRQALPLVTPLAQQHGVRIRTEALSGTARADATRLLQVLINLLSNGIKYGRTGGEVVVGARPDGPVVLVTVNDNGRGMGREQLGHLFEPFNRLGAERSGIEGTGIGLTIVKALVEGMHGTIDVHSRLGSGTRVEVRLPATSNGDLAAERPAEPALPKPGPSEPRSSQQRHGRLLYIEDNGVNVTLVEALVHTLPGLVLHSESTGAAGVASARLCRPDLVLVDMQLPDFDGFEVLRQIRSAQETADIPCIALSANAMPEDVERALAAGFADYWTKPIDFKRFLAAIEERFPVAAVPHAWPEPPVAP